MRVTLKLWCIVASACADACTSTDMLWSEILSSKACDMNRLKKLALCVAFSELVNSLVSDVISVVANECAAEELFECV